MADAKNQLDSFFALKKPCDNCPFRKEGAIDLHPDRVPGIIAALLADDGLAFHCHKTTHLGDPEDAECDWDDDECSGIYKPSGKESMCAGAMVYLEKVGRPSVQMRFGAITGHYDAKAIKALQDIVVDALPTQGQV